MRRITNQLKIIAAFLTLLILCIIPFGCTDTESIHIPDKNLETRLKYSIGKWAGGEITAFDMTFIDILSFGGRDIRELSGLEYCINITSLDLHENQISDISSISSMANLEVLNLSGSQISDIYPLVQNEYLGTGDTIDLRDNPLSEESINTHIPQLKEKGINIRY